LGLSYGLEMVINPTKEKRLTNFRMTGHEEQIKIADPKVFTIEEALGMI
jgi:GTP-binding protein